MTSTAMGVWMGHCISPSRSSPHPGDRGLQPIIDADPSAHAICRSPEPPGIPATCAMAYDLPVATQRRRLVTGRLLHGFDEEEAANREFWATYSGEERVALLWAMVREARAIRGLHGDEPRLQRSVGRLVRR